MITNSNNQEAEDNQGAMDSLNTFNDNFKFNEEEEEFDMKDFIGNHSPEQQAGLEEQEEEQEQSDPSTGGLDDENDVLNFGEEGEETEKDDDAQSKVDLDFFNKTLNKDFKTREELQSYLQKEKEVENVETEEKTLEDAQKNVEFFSDILKLNNEGLMRRQLEFKAMNEKKDINDEDVKYEIEEALERMKDNYVLDTNADVLR
jgi:hypothetical protein